MKRKGWVVVLIIILAVGGFAWWWFTSGQDIIAEADNDRDGGPYYNNFTGLEITNLSLNDEPTFCVQIPNGSTDGARPQAGLTHAGVVFEAIAETGITRFAAIFQNPETGVIGPIRSLRPYYLDWDTPFGCTIVHDGGSPEALSALASGNYRDLDENFDYMWKDTNPNRLWNNVFTSPTKLLEFNRKNGYGTSNPQTFPRLKPEEAKGIQDNITTKCISAGTEECLSTPYITTIQTTFTNLSDYIVDYAYDPENNNYLRSYQGTGMHLVYDCPTNITELSRCGGLIQVAPSVIIVMRIQENTMSDDYHENIQTIGQGEAYIFQNGTMIEGIWKKESRNHQIAFTTPDGNDIKFTPGQIWIAAVPQFGNVHWE